jgi:hypothetical protein
MRFLGFYQFLRKIFYLPTFISLALRLIVRLLDHWLAGCQTREKCWFYIGFLIFAPLFTITMPYHALKRRGMTTS